MESAILAKCSCAMTGPSAAATSSSSSDHQRPLLNHYPCSISSSIGTSTFTIADRGSHRRTFLTLRCSTTSSSDKDKGNGIDALQVPSPRPEKGSVVGADDLMKLFNDAQQNMLYLSKQRVTAMENLDKVEREKTLLLARVAQLEAENEASSAGCEVLQKKLKSIEDELQMQVQGGDWAVGDKVSKKKMDPASLWSELNLTIDSLVLKGKIDVGQATLLRGLVLNRDARAAEVFSTLRSIGDNELIGGLLALLDPNRRHSLHIVHICTEMAPLTELGTLGNFVTCLSRALRRKGNLVEVILPKYASMDLSCVCNPIQLEANFRSYFDGTWHNNKIWTGILYGVAITLIDPSHSKKFFSRQHVYDYEDDFERFTYFSRAALDYIIKAAKRPDILHIHNWQTAAVAPLFWDNFASQGLGQTRILFTCHDLSSQYLHEPHKLALCGLNPGQLHRIDRLQDNSEPRLVNLVKGGIVYSNKVTTVSPTYAHDLLTKELGQGLESTFQIHKNKFVGILNGLDESKWDPQKDRYLPCTYGIEDFSGKRKCKEELLKRLGFSSLNLSIPLVGCIAADLSDSELNILEDILNLKSSQQAQFVFAGGSKNPRIQTLLETIEPSQKDMKSQLVTNYDEALIHLVVAASDILICLTFSEPTYQTPLIAMKYGTIPVARSVYGLSGCVIDAEDQSSRMSERTGYTFVSQKVLDVTAALSRALDKMQEKDPVGWKYLIANGMRTNFSWDTGCVESYLEAYRSIQAL
ncbi:hypothetical protein O6H91_19G085600 [Diphasiastrum complanatum]|uniref:Uncharacterized protein n=1 Tax=Diphasiastrum complanatum TaxID=34168 RepID=A0ACC2AXJ6_DIPCM|nr:hypothetical protein O6H91_19G085600 [Diphasiastrum complanatum]